MQQRYYMKQREPRDKSIRDWRVVNNKTACPKKLPDKNINFLSPKPSQKSSLQRLRTTKRPRINTLKNQEPPPHISARSTKELEVKQDV